AIQHYTGAPWGLALIVVVLVAPVIEPQFLALALARYLARRGRNPAGVSAAVAGACGYVAAEWAFPKLFADTLGHGLYPSVWMRQAADLAGAHGLTFVLIIANECVLRAARAILDRPAPSLRRLLAPMTSLAILVVTLLSYGALRWHQLERPGASRPAVTAGVAQANISQYARLAAGVGTFDAVRTILDTHYALSTVAMQHGDVDVLVWPETVYPTTFGSPKSEAGADFDREIGQFVNRVGVPLVFGAYDAADGDEFNAAIFLEPAGD